MRKQSRGRAVVVIGREEEEDCRIWEVTPGPTFVTGFAFGSETRIL